MEINRRPKSLNFADAAEPCLRHMTLNYDADHDYVPYVGVTLGEKKPHFVHHRLDWSEVLPYAIYGEICARDLCGSQEGLEIEKKQRELFLSSYVTRYGSTPCTEPACSNMELIYSAIHLAETVDASYYEQIDRYVRNQTKEAQFLTKSEWHRELAHEGRITGEEFRWVFGNYSDTLDTLPYDYYGDDVLDKSEGGFLWTDFSEHRFVPASLMLCCSGHAMRSFHLVAEKMIHPTIQGFDVNFHYSFENEYAELISYEPFEGKFVVIPKKCTQKIRVRIPEYWEKTKLQIFSEGAEILFKIEGNYVVIQNAEAGQEIQFKYPLESYITEENVYRNINSIPCFQFKVRVEWKGNTVIRLLDHCSENPKMIYKHVSNDYIYGGKPLKVSGHINW